MLERFIATDQGFAEAHRLIS
ncbi:hypothetical protein U1R88_33920 [Labrys sp. ZIDIC5]|nr:hypothetical protein [Labrys sp. ZIDIC5]MDZ5454653.1 hypothetical protein [Labrys sp. ZIDIC5]